MNYSTTLSTAAVLACCMSSAQAASIDTLTLTGATLEGRLVPNGLITFTPGASTDLITALVSDNFTVSTTTAIQGDLDFSDSMITLNIDDWILSGNGTSQLSGGIATGTWDGDAFTVSWAQTLETPLVAFADLDLSRSVIWTLTGTAAAMNPIPVPAALWLLGSGILALSGFKRHTT